MSGAGPLGLSLLSRGIGEVQNKGQEKVEVLLEPSDYLNFRAADRPYSLPPVPSAAYPLPQSGPALSAQTAKDVSNMALPKTFSTRKGALLLFSEDLALKAKEQQKVRKTGRAQYRLLGHSPVLPPGRGIVHDDDTAIALKTVDDLAKSILHYGAGDVNEDDLKIHLKFVRHGRETLDRQIRPGYSAKRYLSTWSRSWDDHMLDTVLNKGYLTEGSLFQYSLYLPNLSRPLFHGDLSSSPQPYRLMKAMLFTPGSLSGFNFFRAPEDWDVLDEEREEDSPIPRPARADSRLSIRVIRTSKEGAQEEVRYCILDMDTQKAVIIDLLVKSAVFYAISKQEEMLDLSIGWAGQKQQQGPLDACKSSLKRIPSFDMRDAVESLLESQRYGPYVLGGDLTDGRSPRGDHSPVPRAGDLTHRSTGATHSPRASVPRDQETGREVPEDGPVITSSRNVSRTSSVSSVPQLPPISRHPLSPIKDVSRETSRLLALPALYRDDLYEGKNDDDGKPTVQVMPATPQHSTLGALPTMSTPGTLANMSTSAALPVMSTKGAFSVMPNTTVLPTMPTKAAVPAMSTPGTWSTFALRNDHRNQQGLPDIEPATSEVSAYNISNDSSVTEPSGFQQRPPAGRWGRNRGGKAPYLVSVYSSLESLVPEINDLDCSGSVTDDAPTTGRSISGARGDSASLKGSLVMAPDGEIVNVGGTIAPSRPDVGLLHDVTPRQRHFDGGMTTDESGVSDEEPEDWRMSGRRKTSRSTSSMKSDSVRSLAMKRVSQTSESSVTEQDILDTLTEHARHIADNIFSHDQAGKHLEEDIRNAADMWMDCHPAADPSPTQPAAPDALKTGTLEEIMQAYREASADTTAAEYKALIQQALTTAVAKAAGLSPEQIPEDMELSPDLLEALASQRLTPEDLAIAYDEQTGRPVLRSRQDPEGASAAAGDEERPYVAASTADGQDPASLSKNLEFDVINYGNNELEARTEHGGVAEAVTEDAGGPRDTERDIVQQDGPLKSSPNTSRQEESKSEAVEKAAVGVSETVVLPESELLKKTAKPSEEPFVTGVVDHKAELSQLYGMPLAAASSQSTGKSKKAKKEGKKKGKKGRKGKKEEETSPDTEGETSPPLTEDADRTSEAAPRSSESSARQSPDGARKEEMPEGGTARNDPGASSRKASIPADLPDEGLEDEEEEDLDDGDGEDDALKSQANREARAAKRAAAAAKRKEEVERRRKEREEQLKLNKGELERQEQLKREVELERQRREEQRRLRMEREEEEAEREEREQRERERRKQLEEEKERKAKEEYERKREELKRKQMEEEERRKELQLQREREEEERRAQEELMLSQMEEQERQEYERRKREEAEERQRREEEERRLREEEAQKAMAEARRLAEEMARKQAALEAKLKFNRSLRLEARHLDRAQDINRAFVFSYFQLLQWLGLDMPPLEMGRY